MKKKNNARIISNSIVLLIIASSFVFYAYEDGITEATRKNGIGCSTGSECHVSTPSTNVIVTINGPDELAMNETGTYTVTITGGPLVRGGTNIAASAGTLIPGEGLRKLDDELTHIGPKAPAGGMVTFQFTYTAPAVSGEQTIFANGNSVNFNGRSDGDSWNFAQNKTVTITNTTDVKDENLVNTYKLYQNFPNPFNPVTKIQYSVAEAGNVQIVVYNLSGEKIKTLVNEVKSPGNYTAELYADDLTAGSQGLSSGVYIYQMITDKYSSAKKMILTK